MLRAWRKTICAVSFGKYSLEKKRGRAFAGNKKRNALPIVRCAFRLLLALV
jgi:hypothetical protein